MDLRIQRTRKNIRDAFIELRSRKPIEKITVKELAEAAFINKATFYQHYEDLYDLSESMENELIDNIISSIFRGLGDSKSPMYFIAVACGANIALDYLFIGVLGMNGATVASLISCAAGISVMIICLVFQLKVQWR